MAAPSEKCVLILDQDLPAGLLANTAAFWASPWVSVGQPDIITPPLLR